MIRALGSLAFEKMVAFGAVVGSSAVAVVSEIDGTWAEKVGEQVPGMVALGIVVWLFLRHIEASDRKRAEEQAARDKLFAENLATASAAANEAIGKNSVALDRNAEMIGRVLQIIEVLDLRSRRTDAS